MRVNTLNVKKDYLAIDTNTPYIKQTAIQNQQLIVDLKATKLGISF